MKLKTEKKMDLFIPSLILSAVMLLCIIFLNSHICGKIFSWSFVILVILAGIMWLVSENSKSDNLIKSCCENTNWISVLSCFGILIRYFYIVYTDVFTRQHDIGEFGDEGHLGYIWYLYSNNFSLPQSDPRDMWQFYHPPLHHIIEALWLKLLVFFGVSDSYEVLYTCVQIPLFMYSCAAMWIIYRIFRELGLQGKGLILSYALVCFNPTFILMSGSANNDLLSSVFIYASVLYTILWYKNPCMKNIIKIALSIGLGMMTKLSAALIAPAVALVFAVKFIQQVKRKNIFPFSFQYIVFLIICCPLGLWWSIRCYLKFGMPLNYIAEIPEDSFQYLGHMGWLERITDFSLYQFKNVFIQWNFNGDSYLEFNPFIAFMKTAVFGEFDFNDFNSHLVIAPKILFYSNIALMVISFISMIYITASRKSKLNPLIKVFLITVFLIFSGNYLIFCYKYPFTCTMNIRYVTVLIVLGIYFTGAAYERTDCSKNIPGIAAGFMIPLTSFIFAGASLFSYAALACIG